MDPCVQPKGHPIMHLPTFVSSGTFELKILIKMISWQEGHNTYSPVHGFGLYVRKNLSSVFTLESNSSAKSAFSTTSIWARSSATNLRIIPTFNMLLRRKCPAGSLLFAIHLWACASDPDTSYTPLGIPCPNMLHPETFELAVLKQQDYNSRGPTDGRYA